jgi:hypothetical protein
MEASIQVERKTSYRLFISFLGGDSQDDFAEGAALGNEAKRILEVLDRK